MIEKPFPGLGEDSRKNLPAGLALGAVLGLAVLLEGIIRAKDAESNLRLAEQLETLLAQVAQLNRGAFSPLSQQPLVKALLFPLSSAGWVALIENGTIPGL